MVGVKCRNWSRGRSARIRRSILRVHANSARAGIPLRPLVPFHALRPRFQLSLEGMNAARGVAGRLNKLLGSDTVRLCLDCGFAGINIHVG